MVLIVSTPLRVAASYFLVFAVGAMVTYYRLGDLERKEWTPVDATSDI